ncbi:glypican-6 [Trichonephila clavipes]|nr:glypican-6 [Trichonephila clavipes]
MIPEELVISTENVCFILTEDMGKQKLCCRLIPHRLTPEQMDMRLGTCGNLIDMAEEERKFLNNIVTGDESWCLKYDPKRANGKVWSAGVHRCLKNPTKYAKQGSWTLLHDNGQPHTALVIMQFLAANGVVTLDLAPADFFLFPRLKLTLKGKRFIYTDITDIQSNVTLSRKPYRRNCFTGVSGTYILIPNSALPSMEIILKDNSLINLVSRLENSYNIESVLEPIDIKISEAIMNFQENGVAISKKLFHKCGKPRLGKRDLSDQEIPLEKLKFLHNHGARPTTAAGTSIERLVDNLKKKTKKIKKFWQELPLKMCSHSLMEEGSEGCWDGNTETRNVNASIKHLLSFKDSKEPNENPIINQQILTLNLISTKLSHAYKGLDVEWEDSVDSSSGSGSGSGFGNVATSEDFEDLFFSVPRASPTNKVPSYQTPTTTSSGTLKYFSLNVLVLVILIKWALS